MTPFVWLLLFTPASTPPGQEEQIKRYLAEIAQSGRVAEIGESKQRLLDPRQQVAPGQPPLFSFRYFQGAERHRFGRLDLMLDDAGH